MDIRSFDPNFQSDGFLVYVIRKIGFLPLVRPWGQHPYLVLLAYLWTFRNPFETPSLPFQNPFGFHLPANPAPVVVDQTNQCRNTSNGSKHRHTKVCRISESPLLLLSKAGTQCLTRRPRLRSGLQCFFPFFVFLDFSQNGSCQVFSLCDSKRGTPNPGLSIGPAPIFGPAAPCVDRFSKTRFGGGDL